jgi:hypothetical protein
MTLCVCGTIAVVAGATATVLASVASVGCLASGALAALTVGTPTSSFGAIASLAIAASGAIGTRPLSAA